MLGGIAVHADVLAALEVICEALVVAGVLFISKALSALGSKRPRAVINSLAPAVVIIQVAISSLTRDQLPLGRTHEGCGGT